MKKTAALCVTTRTSDTVIARVQHSFCSFSACCDAGLEGGQATPEPAMGGAACSCSDTGAQRVLGPVPSVRHLTEAQNWVRPDDSYDAVTPHRNA